MKTVPITFFFFLLHLACLGQNGEELKKVDNGIDPCELLGCDNEIEKVELVSELDGSFIFGVHLKGFTDKKYKIKARILSRNKKPLKEYKEFVKELSRGGGAMDIEFEFKPLSRYLRGREYVKTAFLSIMICESDDSLCDLDLGGINISGTSVTYHLKKKISLDYVPCSDCPPPPPTVVDLIPYKSARTIKP